MDDLPLLAAVPTETFVFPTMAGYRMEPKIDGHRVLIDYRGDHPRILNRNGQPYGAGPFKIEIPGRLQGVVLDGEYLPQERGAYVVIDCLKAAWDSHLVYNRVLASRRAFASDYVVKWNDTRVTLGICDPATVDAMNAWKASMTYIDGVVFKRTDGIYVPGKSNTWLKYKFTNDIDCVVSQLNIDSKANCALSLWDSLSKNWFEIGKASTSGKGKIKIDDVVKVRFLTFTGKRLREPRIVEIRDDKKPTACTVEQLIPFVPQLNKEDA